MDLNNINNISLNIPIKAIIEADGGYYAECARCCNEIDPHNNICPYCHQLQDWSWFWKGEI